MRFKDEDGQAIILVAVAMSIFLIGAIGLAVDGSNLYTQRQQAQAAADAAAQAGIMSIFDGTNSTGTAGFATTGPFTCTTTDTETPCVYASNNGFGGTSSDTVTVSFPADTAAPGVSFSGDPINLIQVSVSRSVNTTLMRLLGPAATTVTATAMAGIVDVIAPVPILVTHPGLPPGKAGPPFQLQGTPTITICGGPTRSIQVNSNAAPALKLGGNSSVDLSHAGPPDPGDCSLGTGADFGVFGGPSTKPSGINIGSPATTGHYSQPASPILDPLAGVVPPPAPTTLGTQQPLAAGVNGCPAGTKGGCTLYTPGLYTGGIDGKLQTAVFAPGIYYIQGGGFQCSANCNLSMSTGLVDTSNSNVLPACCGTSTNWDGTQLGGGMLVYNTGTGTGKSSTYAPINLGANGTISLIGAPLASSYFAMLFFEDRSAPLLSHTLGGGGAMTLLGTIYLTNTLQTMNTTAGAQYQALSLQGGSGSGTLIQGEIIVGTLSMGGNGSITMNLNSSSVLNIRQVAMVN